MEAHQLNNDKKQREKEGCCALVAKPPTEKKTLFDMFRRACLTTDKGDF
jgi:hypothetical protein